MSRGPTAGAGPLRRIAIVMAMRAEAAPVVAALGAVPTDPPAPRFHEWHGVVRGDVEVLLAVNGVDPRHGVDAIGTEPAVLHTAAVIERFEPDLVVSAGTAGGWRRTGGSIGDVYLSHPHVVRHDRRIDLAGFDRYGIGTYPVVPARLLADRLGARLGIVTTGNSLDETEDDRRLIAASGASVKDMEAAGVAYVCELSGVPFLAVKAITDLVDAPEPTVEQFLANLATASVRLAEVVVAMVDDLAGRGLHELDEIWDHRGMHETLTTLTTDDGTALALYRWTGDAPPRAIVQIAHGMGEHAARYRRLAAALVDAGYAVYADDHRGHGITAGSPEHHGDLGPGGWSGLVGDLGAVGAHARSEFPGVPLVVLGHSMGSFALQQYLLDHSVSLDAAVLSGTTAADVIAAGMDPEAEVDLSAFNAPFEPARTEYDWLSRDEAEVDLYVADPACGFGLDAPSGAAMFSGVLATGDVDRIAAIRNDLPILVISGDADPLAAGGPLVEMVGERYRVAGIADVTVQLYPGARHEIFNETNRDEVTADLLAWLDRVLA